MVMDREQQMEVEVTRFYHEQDKWFDVSGFPGRALFVGAVASHLVDTTNAVPGIQENCLYFTRRHGGIAVFSMEEQQTSTLAIAGGHSVDVEPVWILPFIA